MVTVPTAPGPFVITDHGIDFFEGGSHLNSTGGATILEWQLAWGTSPNSAQFTGNIDMMTGEAYVNVGLTAGETYYVWNRARNSVGWSPLSTRTQVKLDNTPRPPGTPFVVMRNQTAANLISAPSPDNGGKPITLYRWTYGLTPSGGALVTTVPPDLTLNLSGLIPGETYYAKIQAENVYGWGPFSNAREIRLDAGGYVKVGLVWKRAVPYVKVSGVWVMARTWAKSGGVWNETAD